MAQVFDPHDDYNHCVIRGVEKLAEAMATGTDIVINELPYSLLTRAKSHKRQRP